MHMNSILNISVFCVPWLLASCAGSKTGYQSGGVQIISATSQRWYGGTEESGWGIDYTFQVRFDKTAGYVFDTVWIEDRAYIPRLSQYMLDVRKDIGPVDTIPMHCTYHKPNSPTDEYAEYPPRSDGPEYDGAALLIYHLQGMRYALAVDSIKVLPAVYYP